MDLSQSQLELMLLKHVSTSASCMDKALERGISDYHFLPEEDSINLKGRLFNLMCGYYAESGGLLFTDLVLENILISKNAKDKTKLMFLTLWSEVKDTEINPNDFHAILESIKRRYSLKLTAEMFKKGRDVLSEEGLENTLNVLQDYISNISNEILDIPQEKQSFDFTESADYFKLEYEKRLNQPELYRGIESGLSNIDIKTFGWLPGQLIVLLAPSSGGKSVQLLNWAMTANKIQKKKVLYFSFEMSSWLCMLRHLSLYFEIPYSQIKSVSLTSEDLDNINKGLEAINKDCYFIYDVNMESPTPEYVDSKIREITATKGKPDLVVCDYIGNMYSQKSRKDAKYWEKHGDAAEGLFIVAKKHNIPIATAQQINRETIKENRKSKESGKAAAYGQDAASGDQRLMHLAYYVIGMEPDKENKLCWYHPVKMRDAWFKPFVAQWNTDFNQVIEIPEEDQEKWQAMRRSSDGESDFKNPNVSADISPNLELDDSIPDFDLEIDMSSWQVD